MAGFVTPFVVMALAYLGVVLWVNRNRPPGDEISVLKHPSGLAQHVGASLDITVWNVGYAGLGKGSDFITDGGKSRFPPSRKAVADNLNAIIETLSQTRADLFLLQEVSDRSPLSFWHPVRTRIIESLSQRVAFFRSDISSRGLPFPIRIVHGTLTLSNAIPVSTQVVKLPAEPTFLGGTIKRNYGLLVTRFAIENLETRWVIANLHLAAFDPEGATRFKQLEAVFDFARHEYEQGNYVVLGGDWNLALAKSNFPHTTDIKQLFWLVDFPEDKLPPGWKIACDKTRPTVRTNYQPYVKDENYTAIIDGFIVSPNVTINKVTTTDTGFEHTDHMPVSASFSTKPQEGLK